MSVAGSPSAMHCSLALGVDPAPDADEAVVLELVADRRRVGVARMHAGLARERHQRVHDRGLQVGVAGRSGGAHAADRALEQRVAGEHVGAVDEQREHAGGVAGGVQRLDRERAGADRLAGRERAGRLGDLAPLELVDQHRRVRERRDRLVEVDDMIAVMVGEQDVGERELTALHELDQRRDRAARVDHHRVAAGLVGDDVVVREEAVAHRAFDDHVPHPTPRGTLVPMSLIHTCYRITDIDRSVAFYEALGLQGGPAARRSATRRSTSS